MGRGRQSQDTDTNNEQEEDVYVTCHQEVQGGCGVGTGCAGVIQC